jgi:hypothetical protein
MQEDEPGVMKTEDVAKEVVRRYPDLAPHLPIYSTMMKKGDVVVGRKSTDVSFIAWFLVAAKTRHECLRVAAKVQSSFPDCYELE